MFLITGCYDITNNKALQVNTEEEAVDFFLELVQSWDFIKVESNDIEALTAYLDLSQDRSYIEFYDREDEDMVAPINCIIIPPQNISSMTPATHLHLSVIVSIPKILVSPPKTFLRF
jgi:hypothetical protein